MPPLPFVVKGAKVCTAKKPKEQVCLAPILVHLTVKHAESTAPDVKKPLKKEKTTPNSHSVMRHEKYALLAPLN